jgi:arsenite-transporting ATPase
MRNAEKIQGPVHLITPLMRLQDPAYTKVLVVALPETTPVQEAERLQADLRRAGIEPWAWILNRSLAAAIPTDQVLHARALLELAHVERVRRELSPRVTVLPWLAEPPIGPDCLHALASTSRPPKEPACPSLAS